MVEACYEEVYEEVVNVGRVHEDATRKSLPWNLGFVADAPMPTRIHTLVLLSLLLVTLCGWECNRRSGIALATRYRLQWCNRRLKVLSPGALLRGTAWHVRYRVRCRRSMRRPRAAPHDNAPGVNTAGYINVFDYARIPRRRHRLPRRHPPEYFRGDVGVSARILARKSVAVSASWNAGFRQRNA